MEFRVYAAFGYVTKVVSDGRVNAELHAGCGFPALCCIADLQSAGQQFSRVITNLNMLQNEILRYG